MAKKFEVTTTYKFNSTNEVTSVSKVVNGLKKANTQKQINEEWVNAHSKRFTFINTEIKEVE